MMDKEGKRHHIRVTDIIGPKKEPAEMVLQATIPISAYMELDKAARERNESVNDAVLNAVREYTGRVRNTKSTPPPEDTGSGVEGEGGSEERGGRMTRRWYPSSDTKKHYIYKDSAFADFDAEVEVRLHEDGTLDEVVGFNSFIHIEQMSDQGWYIGIGELQVWLTTKRATISATYDPNVGDDGGQEVVKKSGDDDVRTPL